MKNLPAFLAAALFNEAGFPVQGLIFRKENLHENQT